LYEFWTTEKLLHERPPPPHIVSLTMTFVAALKLWESVE
jgi:hypothetical protein